jgi:hypothetical protein
MKHVHVVPNTLVPPGHAVFEIIDQKKENAQQV